LKLVFNKKEHSIQTGYYVLSTNPIIIVTVWNLWVEHGVGKIFSENFRGKKVYFVFLLWWSFESKNEVRKIQKSLYKQKKYYPKHEFIFLCNTKREYRLFKKFNLSCIFCNQNAFLDGKIFTIKPGYKKKYDAIYNARMLPFKRHHLASKIDNLALLTYFDNTKNSRGYYLKTKKRLPKATWLNKPFLGGVNKFITPTMCSQYLNQAKVGLCLSAKEGAMYACVEYLLCGLPVVSTRSIGGRVIFFDNDYVKIVDGKPISVKEAVDEVIKKNISSNYIRMKTLLKIKPHRERFITLIQEIYDKEGVNKKFRDEWNKIFINKMLLWQEIDLIKNYIKK